MASFNKVILMGNLTRDVELKYTSSQTAVTEVTLAVNDRKKARTVSGRTKRLSLMSLCGDGQPKLPTNTSVKVPES